MADGSRSLLLVELVFGTVGKLFEVALRLLGLLGRLWMEEKTLLVYHVLQYFLSWLEAIPRPVKHLLAYDLLLFVMKAVEIGMCQAFFYGVTLIWIESQHLGEQISGCGLNIREKLLPGLFRSFRQRFDVLYRVLIA